MSKVLDTWVYHAELAPKIVSADEAKELHKQGWADSPASVKKPKAKSKAKKATK